MHLSATASIDWNDARGVPHFTDAYDAVAAGSRHALMHRGVHHDQTMFKLPKSRDKDENIDGVRLEMAKAWDQSFRA